MVEHKLRRIMQIELSFFSLGMRVSWEKNTFLTYKNSFAQTKKQAYHFYSFYA